jgi:hypothetical protein
MVPSGECLECGSLCYPKHRILHDERVHNETVNACIAAVEKWVEHYPKDVFPENSSSSDARVAGMFRRAAKNIIEELKELRR